MNDLADGHEVNRQAMQGKVLFVVNTPWFFLSHRLPVALRAKALGCEVHVATMPGDDVAKIVAHGFTHHALPLTASGRHPWRELRSLVAMFRLFREVRPDLVHLVTIKPVLYGGIAARLARVPAMVAAISGLGYVFTARGVSARAMRALIVRFYRVALAHPRLRVIFQNAEDRDRLLGFGAVIPPQVVMIRGSGVDLARYAHVPAPPAAPAIVVMASRLLYDKGVREFVEAARLLRAEGIDARFLLVGDPDPGNPAAVAAEDLARWRDEGIVECLGHCRDIPRLFADAHVVVLPSYYREGLPKVLAEAAACGRAVVTTDVAGCRDAIVAGETGVLVQPRDVRGLADAIARLLANPQERQRMGQAGRRLAEREFAVERIVDEHMAVYRRLLGAST